MRTQTDLVPRGEQGFLESMSHELSDECVTAALEANVSFIEQKQKSRQVKEIYIPNDTEEFVRHQYPIWEVTPVLTEEELKAAADEDKIRELSVALTMEEIMSTTAFSLLEDVKTSLEGAAAESAHRHKAEVEDISAQLSSLRVELQESQTINEANENELEIMRAFMKEHDLDPKKTKQKALKAKVSRLEDETTEKSYKVSLHCNY